MKKIFRRIGIVILIPVLLLVILFSLFYFPPFQNWAVRQVAVYASEKTGMEISVERVRLAFPLDLSVVGVKVIKPDSTDNRRDTIASIGNTIVDIQLLPLLSQNIVIDELSFEEMHVNTDGFIPQAIIKGNIGNLALQSHGIDLAAETVALDNVSIKDAIVDIAMTDSVVEDTSTSENFWKIDVGQLAVSHSDITFRTFGDSMVVSSGIERLLVKEGHFDLHKSLYQVGKAEWNGGTLCYDNTYSPKTVGLDPSHLKLTNIAISISDIYYCDPKLSASIHGCSFNEKSGLTLKEIAGNISLDSTRMKLPDLSVKTEHSSLTAKLAMDLNTFDSIAPGKLHATMHGSFGKSDLMLFLADMPSDFIRRWPEQPLAIDAILSGNMERMNIDEIIVKLPTAFNAKARGFAANISDMSKLAAQADIEASTQNMGFVTALLDKNVAAKIRIPSGIGLKARVNADGSKYSTNFKLSEGGGNISGKASIDLSSDRYMAKISANRLPLQHFVTGMGLSSLTAKADISGRGFDFLSPKTSLDADIDLTHFSIAGYSLDGIRGNAQMSNGLAHATINSDNKMLNGNIGIDAMTNGNKLSATLACQFSELDLYKLGVVESPLNVSMCTHLDMSTNLNDTHAIQGSIGDIVLQDNDGIYRPEDIDMDVILRPDTTHAIVSCGDFYLNMDASGSYEDLLSAIGNVSDEVIRQMDERYIDQPMLRKRLPLASIKLNSGSENVVARMLKRYSIGCGSLAMDMTSSPTSGLNGYMRANAMTVSDILVDTASLVIFSDSSNVSYRMQVHNNKDNPDYIFNAIVEGTLTEKGTTIKSRLYDWKDRLGLATDMSAAMEDNGVKVTFIGDGPVLGYKKFAVNKDNYLFLSEDKRVSANLKLRASDGTGLQVYTNDENADALQDITLSVNKLDLDDIFAILPFTPNMTGILDGDFHAIQTPDELTVSSSLTVSNMIYEGCKMGDVGTEFTYMPLSNGSHSVDGIMIHNGQEIGTLSGTYASEGDGFLDATLSLAHTPLSLVNGFIPDQLFGLNGYCEGDLSVKGALSQPQVNGELYLDSAYIFSLPYGVEMRFGNDPVTISGSRLLLENFEMYSHNDKPLTTSGYIDFSNLDNMYADIRMRADNFLIIDAKENSRSEAFGKAYVNFYGRMQGPVENLRLRGKLDVLGSTDMTYILRDSPITTDNQLDDLVKFTNFADSVEMSVTRPPLSGFNMDLTMSVNESAHILCALNANKSNYIDLIGGGDLRMQYDAIDGLSLRGRYTLNNGEMKYSLPVIPLKTFVIQDGSYVEFTGDPMNPRLNITALETTKAAVSDDGGGTRSVEFNCGVIITKTLNDMGLEFVIYAPQDMTISNQLNTMSIEERGKLAVTMLTTGMYLADGNTNSFSMNSALSAFLQNQINGIAGNALRTLDLSFGLDNTTDASGNTRTDYSFKFSKRFWNNRLRIIVGGKLSTGSDMSNQNESFFNNVQFEYRLNENSTQYLNLFYNRDSYDWLEGNIGEYGGGFIWRRKLRTFGDIFRLKETSSVPPLIQPADTTKAKTE